MKFMYYVVGGLIAIAGGVIAVTSFTDGFNLGLFALGVILLLFGLYVTRYHKVRSTYLADRKEKHEEIEQMVRHLEQARLEDLPTFEVPVQLQKNEACYLLAEVAWKEERKATHSRKYKGMGVSIKLMKGVYYRVGNIKTVPNTKTELTLIDSGTLYFTNKHLIFAGNKGNKVIPLNKVFDLTLYSDAITVQKETGKPASLFPTDGTPTQLMVAMIYKLIQ